MQLSQVYAAISWPSQMRWNSRSKRWTACCKAKGAVAAITNTSSRFSAGCGGGQGNRSTRGLLAIGLDQRLEFRGAALPLVSVLRCNRSSRWSKGGLPRWRLDGSACARSALDAALPGHPQRSVSAPFSLGGRPGQVWIHGAVIPVPSFPRDISEGELGSVNDGDGATAWNPRSEW